MSDRTERILLVDHDRTWAERFVNALQVRGWNITWSIDSEFITQQPLFSVYLLNLSHPNLDPRSLCQSIRQLPKGENASIFLLNDGSAALKSFEEALSIKADGLYFHHAQLPLLLANFPPKQGDKEKNSSTQIERSHTMSSRNISPMMTLGGERNAILLKPSEDTLHQRVVNHDRVVGMSLGYRNRQRLSLGHQSEVGLSVADVEAALNEVQQNEDSEPTSQQTPIPSSSNGTQQQALVEHTVISEPSIISQSLSPWPRRSSPHSTEIIQGDRRATAELFTPLPLSVTPPPSSTTASVKLSDTSFASFFAQLITRRQSVNVHIVEQVQGRRTPREWDLYIQEGELVGVEASHLDELFVRHLIGQGELSPRDAEQILAKSRTKLPASGKLDVLIEEIIELEQSLITRLETHQREVSLRAFQQIFELTEGGIDVSPFHRPLEPLRFKSSSPQLLINGIQRAYGRLRLYNQFTTLKSIPIISQVSLYTNGIGDRERSLIEGAKGHRSIAELAEDTNLSPLDALSLCYAFSLLGELSIIENSPLRTFYQRACTEDYFQLLSLKYNAQSEDVEEAWRSHRQWIGEQRGEPADVEPLIDVLNDAYCVLMHPPLRVRYLHSLRKPVYSETSVMPEAKKPSE